MKSLIHIKIHYYLQCQILNNLRVHNFQKIEKENKDVVIYYNPNINEGLIGIIAARLKDHFNKPSIVITASNELLKIGLIT